MTMTSIRMANQAIKTSNIIVHRVARRGLQCCASLPSNAVQYPSTTARTTPPPKRSFSSSSNPDNLPSKGIDNQVQTVSSDGVVGTPINFDIASKVEGNESQIVTISLEPGQVLRAESGSMMYMTVRYPTEYCVDTRNIL